MSPEAVFSMGVNSLLLEGVSVVPIDDVRGLEEEQSGRFGV
jgi:hypothetical protein